MAIPTRFITIDSRGPIPQKSGIHGPITRPYYEDVRVIARMLVGRIQVTEHLENGETRKLTIKDIPELTAEAPKVLPKNPVIKAERSAVQQLVDEKKQEHLASKEKELEEAKKEVNADEKVVTAPKEEEVVVPRSALSKKERKALAAKEAAEKAATEQQQ